MKKSQSRLRIGVVAFARSTFDIPFAEETAAQAWSILKQTNTVLIGSPKLLCNEKAVERELSALRVVDLDLLLILQLTFTDAKMTVKVAKSFDAPLLFWSFPEERSGGRLRLNSLCGINLAAHALGKNYFKYDYLYMHPKYPKALKELEACLSVFQACKYLSETKLAIFGKHPDGFHTCAYNPEELKKLCGVTVDQLELQDLFNEADDISDKIIKKVRKELKTKIKGLEFVEQTPLEKSLRILVALRQKALTEGYQGFAVRCWPEFFTEYGCAVCGALGLLNSDGIACGCEADVYGTVSTLILNFLGEEPSFIADLVEINESEDSGVFWHCGLAPLNMADSVSAVEAGIHSNRKKPLVNEFPLKPGRVTLFRLSQAKNHIRMVVGGGKMLKAPKSFSGTSGVIRFDKPAIEVLETVMLEGLEHHYAITYGDVRGLLYRLARQLSLPILKLC
jgi:L-fucose isomerase-like protein